MRSTEADVGSKAGIGYFLGVTLVLVLVYGLRMMNYDTAGQVIDTTLYEQAAIKQQGSDLPADSSLPVRPVMKLYLSVLSVVFTFLGNKIELIFSLQSVLCGMVLVLYAAALTVLYGRIAAVTGGMLLACSGIYLDGVYSVSPDIVFSFIWSISFLLLAVLNRRSLAAPEPKQQSMWIWLLSGCWIGLICYADITGLLLLLATGRADFKVKKPFYLLGGFLFGLFSAFAIAALAGGAGLSAQIRLWGLLYQCNWGLWGYFIWFAAAGVIVDTGITYIIKYRAERTLPFWEGMEMGDEQSSKPAGMRMSDLLAGSEAEEKEKKKKEKPGKKARVKKEKIKTENTPDDGSVSRYDNTKGISYIKNPLPLPKKPQLKGMEFDEAIGDTELNFDIDIAADDDFDIE